MKDFVLQISCESSREDEIEGRLFLTRSIGSQITEAEGTTTVSAYFDSAEARDEAMRLFESFALRRIDAERVDWLERYQQSLLPLLVGRSFVIAPDAALIAKAGAPHALIIPQELAFGTGSHESTALCIELLEKLDLHGRNGLDVGAGSGVLALAMLRLGARKVIALDIDLDAFRPLRDNRHRNGMREEQMPIFIGSVQALRGGRFDAITMNILPGVIVPLLPEVARHLRGVLILSGILTEQRDEILQACARNRLLRVETREKGEWWAGSFDKA